MKILTISVAAYNAGEYLNRCLDSLVNNNVVDDLDIIVVNDGSTDDTCSIAHGYEKRCPNSIRVVDKANGGHGSTINVSKEMAIGKYYKIVDADDWVEKAGIEQLVEALKHTGADVVFNPYYRVSATTNDKKICRESIDDNEYGKIVSISQITDGVFPVMHSTTFRTDTIKKSNDRITEHCFYVDAEYMIHNLYECDTALFLDFPVYDYYVGTETQSMNIKVLTERREQQRRVCLKCSKFLEKHRVHTDILDMMVTSYIVLQSQIIMTISTWEAKVELKQFIEQLKEIMGNDYRKFIREAEKAHITTIALVDFVDRTGYIFLRPAQMIIRRRLRQIK